MKLRRVNKHFVVVVFMALSYLSHLIERFTSGDNNVPEPVQSLKAGAHVWCLAECGALLFAGDADGNLHAWKIGETEADHLYVRAAAAHTGTIYALCVRGGTPTSRDA